MVTSSATQQDVLVGELALLDGQRQSDAAHMALVTPPRRAHADRRHETLLIFLDLGGGGASGLARAMLERFNRTYWRCSGPVTSALRQAIDAANAHLREENRLMPISHRRRGGLVCAILREQDVYLAQIGPAKALLTQDEQVLLFPKEHAERLPLGVSSGLEVQFSHTTFEAGDRLLLTGESWTEPVQDGGLIDALRKKRPGVAEVMTALERQAGTQPFSALIIECAAPVAQPVAASQAPLPPATQERPTGALRAAPPEFSEPETTLGSAVRGELSEAYDRSRYQSATQVPVGMGYAEQLAQQEEDAGRGRSSKPLVGFSIGREHLHRSRQGLRRFALGLMDAGHAVLLRVLPEPEPDTHQPKPQTRRPSTDNALMMAGIAVAIPLVVAFMVVTFYLQRGDTDRRNALVNQVHEALEVALSGAGGEERELWQAVVQAADEALLVAANDEELLAIRAEAREWLDALDTAVHPGLVLLWDYGPGQGRRLAASRMQVYVLDSATHEVTRHMLDQSHRRVTDDQYVRVAFEGQDVKEKRVGALRDIIWLGEGGAWTNGALIILTTEDELLLHSLSWGLAWLPLDPDVTQSTVRILRPYSGKLYNLIPEQSQIWRYRYSGDGFAAGESYFSVPPPDLQDAVDMTIDGAVYVLLSDAKIYKFFGGELQSFEISGLPEPLERPVAIVSEGDAAGGVLYLADAGTSSIVALSKTGEFVHQITAAGDELSGLEALAIEQDSRTLFVLAGGRLYALALPALPGPSGTSE